MKPSILALDLEGTLISNAISQIPRPGLCRFLEDVRSHVSQLMMFTTVPEERFRSIADLLVREGSAPPWFASIEYIHWTGSTKDLRLATPKLGAALLLDDHRPYVHPGQEHLWVQIPLFASPYPSEDEGLAIALRLLLDRIHATGNFTEASLQEQLKPQAEATGAPRRSDACSSAQKILSDAAVRRDELAAQWHSAAEVSSQLGPSLTSGSGLAGQLRRAGQLLGVYVTKPVPCYRYPDWQFGENGEPVEYLAEILSVLRALDHFEIEPDGLFRSTGWSEAEWFLSPHALLNGMPPAEALTSDPARVLRAARTEFGQEDS
ncbi:NIF family HAD-type phosphatase [Stenotrophomonas maltophilia]|uniref:NIF family HAD-type phosphatase n=1 Tax=Stenotrophomonas maltophilia TaxID=40324 RepID=UPI002E79BE68|nr:NIF family HAD-type phosphatase [Stenotrophomonas maltophilia]